MRPFAPLSALAVVSMLAAPALAAPPTVVITAPASAPEGSAMELSVVVTDPDGDTPTFSWDTDGDGVFGEFANETEITTLPLPSDNPTHAVIVQATDGTETTTEIALIAIQNLPPTITSEPLLEAAVRQLYVYDVRVEDPAGPRDPISYRLTSRPAGMEITGGHIEWTPTPDQRGREVRVILRLDDGDGGEAAQMWTVMVDNNQAPGRATPIEPIDRARVDANTAVTLSAANAADSDEDPLVYRFELSQTALFLEGETILSPDVEEGADGQTSWTTDEVLPPGLWYWRVWAFDGIDEGEASFAQVVVGDGMFIFPDAGPGSTTGGGCAVSQGGPSRSPFLVLGFFALLLLTGRRR